MRIKTLLASLLAISALVLAPTVSFASPFVGQSAPLPGFGPDDGTELWNPLGNVVTFELADTFGTDPSVLTSFGFYRADDPGTLITIFDPNDQDITLDGSDPQLATIDFLNGWVVDDDDVVLQSIFTPGTESIGFYVQLESAAGVLTLYTEAALNPGGEDAFATWESDSTSGFYLLGAEFGDLGLRLDVVTNVAAVPVPEPAAALAFGFGFLVTAAAVRRRASNSSR